VEKTVRRHNKAMQVDGWQQRTIVGRRHCVLVVCRHMVGTVPLRGHWAVVRRET
jgi:hypothetical protein